MIRYQARANIIVDNVLREVWTVHLLPPTSEVLTLVAAGLLVAEDDDGNFPTPVVVPHRCCGR